MASSPRQAPLKSALKHSNHGSPSSSPSATSTSFREAGSAETDSSKINTGLDMKRSTSASTSNLTDANTSANSISHTSDPNADQSGSSKGPTEPWVMVQNVDGGDENHHPDNHHRHGLFHRHHHHHAASNQSSNNPSRPTSPVNSQAQSQSPSLPSTYERKVGFDTMPDADDTVSHSFSFTLQARSKGYRRSNNTRTFMCAVDGNHYSERALEWLVEELCEDGDEIVALRVLEGEADEINQDEAREEARDLLASIVDLNEEVGDRKISIIVEFIAGRITSTIVRLIHMYRPDSLTVGTRGKSTNALQRVLGGASGSSMGSVSRDVLSRSPVPVVVVRPTAKVRKHLKKRQMDPKRRSYHDLIRLGQMEHHHKHKSGSNHLSTVVSPSSSTDENTNSHLDLKSKGPHVDHNQLLSTASTSDPVDELGNLRSPSPLPMSVSRSKRESLGLESKTHDNIWGIAEGLKSSVGHLGKIGSGHGGVRLREREQGEERDKR